jgi:hypothetical protein
MPAFWRNKNSSLVFRVSALLLISLFVGCSGSQTKGPVQTLLSADVAPGVVLVDVLEGGQPEHYWQYQVRPSTGVVRLVREETFQDYKHRDIPRDFSRPTGVIETCTKNPQASSPNGDYLAYCKAGSSSEFYVTHETTQILQDWRSERGIRGFAWAHNSNSVAILTVSSYTGMHPSELLSLLSGHPVPHDSVFLEVLDIRTGKVTEYVVRRNVVSSFTRILSWGEEDGG